MTMVETTVAFTLLIIISLSFLAILHFSSKMTMEADDRRAMAEELDEKLAHANDEGFSPLGSSLVLKEKETGGTVELANCKIYSLNWPATGDVSVTVLRFHYRDN